MNDFFFARSQMGMSLAFHVIFAVIGMAMPLLMTVSEGWYLRTKKPIYLELSKRWAAGTAILFAFAPDVTIQNAAAPEPTLKLLLLALGAGVVVLFPSLLYLFRIFKRQEQR